MKNTPALSRFNKLVADISRLYENARKEQVRFAWETGRRIVEEEQNGAVRAQYGTHLILNLSDELSAKYGKGFSERNLLNMRRLYIENKISQPAAELTLANQVELMRVKDPAIRKDLEKRAVKDCLVRDDLRDLIREKTRSDAVSATRTAVAANTLALEAPQKKLPLLKRPTDLVLYTYKMLDGGDVDCGFRISYPASARERKKVKLIETPSYTYTAFVEEVIDGDTLRVNVDVAFGIRLHDKLRLRGINCPELKEAGGPEAKRFVEERLPVGSTVVIKSRKIIVDNHGRFVMDVLYSKPTSAPQEIIKIGTWLNQELIDAGHAVRMKE